MTRQRFILLLAPLMLGACEQQKQVQDQWAQTQANWVQAETELNTSGRDLMAQLSAIKEGPQAETAAELRQGLDGALNELRKTRLTVIEDVKQGPPGRELEERVAAAGSRMSLALAKVEARLEAAKRLTQPARLEADEKKEKKEEGGEETK